MRIALITCLFSYDNNYDRICNQTEVYENLGVGYIAALLRKNGFQVDIYNENIDKLPRRELLQRIIRRKYRLIGFHVSSVNTTETIEWIKTTPNNIHKCLGGFSATFHPQELIQHESVDSIILGEGEYPFLELAIALQSGSDYTNIPNLVTKEKANPSRRLIDLTLLPHPVRDELQRKMRHVPRKSERRALVSSSRGCFNQCNFCYSNKFYRSFHGPPVRFRPPEDVVDEIESLVKGPLKINYIWLVDEDFISKNPARAMAIAKEILKRKLKVRLEFDCRADSVDFELFSVLKEAGLAHVFIGIESFCQNVLDRYHKNIRVEQNINALRMLQELHINFTIGMIFFDEATTPEELEINLRYCQEFGFAHMNDPIRTIKNYDDFNQVHRQLPSNPEVFAIYHQISQKTEARFEAFFKDQNLHLQQIKSEIGLIFQQLVEMALKNKQ